MAATREELLAAITESRQQITAEMHRGHGSIRSEMAGIRKAVEIVAVKLLADSEVKEMRAAASGN